MILGPENVFLVKNSLFSDQNFFLFPGKRNFSDQAKNFMTKKKNSWPRNHTKDIVKKKVIFLAISTFFFSSAHMRIISLPKITSYAAV